MLCRGAASCRWVLRGACAVFLASAPSPPPTRLLSALTRPSCDVGASTGESLPLRCSGGMEGSACGPSCSTPAGCASTPGPTWRRRVARRPVLLLVKAGVDADTVRRHAPLPMTGAAAAAVLCRRLGRPPPPPPAGDAGLQATAIPPCLQRIGAAPPNEKASRCRLSAVAASRCPGGSVSPGHSLAKLCSAKGLFRKRRNFSYVVSMLLSTWILG